MPLAKTYVSITTSIFVLHIVSKVLVDGRLTIAPEDGEAMLGQSAYFNCSTSIYDKNVHWYFYPVGEGADRIKYIYASGKLLNPYNNNTVRIESDNEGVCNLVILSVTLLDAGRYECQDNGFLGETKSAQLVVLEKDLSCYWNSGVEGYVGPNSCGIAQDNVTLSCGVSYSGNIPPTLHWKKMGTTNTISAGVNNVISGNRLIKNLIVIADLDIDGSVYVCLAKSTNYNCTSNEIKVIYAFNSQSTVQIAVGEEIVCKANTTQTCNYKWEWFDGISTKTVSNNQTLYANRNGNHRCKAECKVKDTQCELEVMLAQVQEISSTASSDAAGIPGGYIALIVIIAIILCLTAVGLIWWFIIRKPKDKPIKTENVTMLKPTNAEDGTKVAESQTLDNIQLKSLLPTLPLIGKGIFGEFYGPWQKRFIWEKIVFSPGVTAHDKVTETIERAEQWEKLVHNNVIKFHGVFCQFPTLGILMEYAQGGTIRRTLDTCESDLTNLVVIDWVMQIADGMSYLHEKDIIHRQLKCSQILLMEPFNQIKPVTNVLKIASFSLAVDDGSVNPSRQLIPWFPPEVLITFVHKKTSDVWSYGVTVWEILTRKTPHKGKKYGQIVNEICDELVRLEIPGSCPVHLRGILTDCWNHEEQKRPLFSAIKSRLLQP